MPDVVLNSPLAEVLAGGPRPLQVDGRPCTLAERAFLDMLNLRGNPADPRFAQAVLQHTGMHLPQRANTASIDPQRQLLWLGPDEWLLKLGPGEGPAAANALRQALQGVHSSVVEVGDGNTTLCVQGAGAADLIARGCPLDLHPRVFPVGSVAQSHLSRASITLLCVEPGTTYEITVRRSFADYLVRWLCAAGE